MGNFTLFDLTYRVARELGMAFEGTATGGTTATIIDTVYLKDRFEDDHFNAGTAWILYDSAGSHIPPEREMARITDFVKTTGVVSVPTGGFTVAVAAGDRYAVADDMYTKDIMTSVINQVLAEIPVAQIEETTFDDSTKDFIFPIAVIDTGIQVWIRYTTDDDEADWKPFNDWQIHESATGTEKTLVFNHYPIEVDVRIKYFMPHDALYATTDKLEESVDINRVVLSSALRLLTWKYAQRTVEDPALERRIAELSLRYENYKWKHPLKNERIKLAALGTFDGEDIVNGYD